MLLEVEGLSKRVLLDKDRYYDYKDSLEVSYINCFNNKKSINEKFLRALIRDEDLYDYFSRVIDGDSGKISIGYFDNEVSREVIDISISDVLRVLSRYDDFSEEEKLKLMSLKSKADMASLLFRIERETYQVIIDDELIEIKCKDLLDVLTTPDHTFQQIFSNEKIHGIERNKFAYILNKFISDYKILEKYSLDAIVQKRCLLLVNQMIVDFESINYLDDDFNKYDIEIDKELENEVLKDMNPNYDKLSKSIYVYIKLCKLLTYDPRFYAGDQVGEVAREHADINRISKINLQNNEVVCFEFNLIYAKFLEMLGINYKIESSSLTYGNGHANLIYVIDKFIVRADSVVSIIDGDLLHAKLNNSLNGLYSMNKSKSSKNEFDNRLDFVYKEMIQAEEGKGLSDFEIKNLLFFYYRYNDENKEESEIEVKLEQRVKYLINQAQNSPLKGMDFLGYCFKLKNLLFTSEEIKNSIDFTILRNNLDNGYPCVIIAINNEEKINDSNQNKYLYYVPKREIKEISKSELESLLKSKRLEYMANNNHKIPGINYDRNRGI